MKTFLATFIGLIGAFVIMMLLEIVGHLLFPIPAELTNDAESLNENLHLIPTGAYIAVVAAHSLGLLGGLLIARAIDKQTLVPVFLVSGFLLFGTIANLTMIAHPLWFTIADIACVFGVAVLVIYNTRKMRT